MRLNHPIEIDLFEFFKTGKFDFLKIGQSKDWILNNFPEPDYPEEEKYLLEEDYWLYGDFEFYFTDNQLMQISTPHIQTLDGGKSIQVKKWIFENPENLTLQYVMAQFAKEGIGFTYRYDERRALYQGSLGLLDKGIHLIFQPENNGEEIDRKLIDPNSFPLQTVILTERKQLQARYHQRESR